MSKYLLLLLLPLFMGAASINITCDDFTWVKINGDLVVNCSSTAVPVQPTPTTDPVISEPVTPENCIVKDIDWPAGLTVTGPNQSLRRGQQVAYRFTMPPRPGIVSSGIYYPSVAMYMNLSRNRCEFTPALEEVHCGPAANSIPTSSIIVGNRTVSSNDNRPVCQTTEGEVYYFNVKSSNGLEGEDTCRQGQQCYFYLSW